MHFITVVAKTTAQQRGNELCIGFFVCITVGDSFLSLRSCACAKPLKTMVLKKKVKAAKLLPLLQNYFKPLSSAHTK